MITQLQFQLNWPAIVEEAKQRRKAQKLTQQRLAMLAGVSTPTLSRFENGERDIQLSSIMHILGMLGMTDPRTLVFPEPREFYDSHREVVVFWGKAGDKAGNKEIRCAISREALIDHYKDDPKNLLKIFIHNRAAIEHEARRKYLANDLESDNTILIKTSDL
jgi:transcriptional regulator with XRE-family HTH domain